MANYMATTEDLKTVADSIRAKGGTTAPLAFPDGFATAVGAIDTAKPEQTKTVSAVKNGPVVVEPDNGKTLSSATVNVNVPSGEKPETAGSEIIKANGKKTFSPPSGGVFSSFTADVQVPIPPAPVTQEKTVSITENGDVTITPDVGKLLSKVIAKVNVAGGGGDIEVKTGTYVPAKDIGYQELIEINTGVSKKITAFVMWSSVYLGKNTASFVSLLYNNSQSPQDSVYGYSNNSGEGRFAFPNTRYASNGVVKFTVRYNAVEVFKAGANFKWLCVAGIPYD